MNAKCCNPVWNDSLDPSIVIPEAATCGSRNPAPAGLARPSRWLHSLTFTLAAVLALGAGYAWAQEDDNPNPHTPGQIQDPSTYTGSMELQRQSDQQYQQNIQQPIFQQPQYPQQQYNPQAVRQGPGSAPGARSQLPPMDAQAFGKLTAADHAAEAAMLRGEYAKAVRLWLPLAERGDVNAQYSLGLMYDRGVGVAVNKAVAARWYRMAADRGYGAAMLNLGTVLALTPRGRADLVSAYKWILLAENYSKDPGVQANAAHNRGILMRMMTYREITQAENQTRNWVAH